MSTPAAAPEPTPDPTPEPTQPVPASVPAPRRRSTAAIVFGVLSAIFAITTVGAGWLYWQARSDLNTANAAVSRLDEKVTVAEAARSDAEADLDDCTSAVQGFLDFAIAAGISGEIPDEMEAAGLVLDLISSCPGVRFDVSELLQAA